MRFLPIVIGFAVLAAALPARAAVVTTGCAEATSCTLAELLAGGDIAVDDVTFESFNFNDGDDFGTVPVDPTLAVVSGGSNATQVWIDFLFDPSLSVEGLDEFVAYVLDFIANVDPLSMRTIVGAELELRNGLIGVNGPGLTEASAGVDMALGDGGFLSVFLAGDDAVFEDSAPVAGLTSLSALTQLSVLAFSEESIAQLRAFRFLLTLEDGGMQPEIPLPAAAPIFAAGLGFLAFLRRRRKA